ncbi:hypothetical protein CW751_04380 [Brumimicrobium salinarum]|uniref:Uncharacterized protein n=1 Tax=Brumimicrobium salinarum TaxID=2058658 RepID=A0A2I0R3Z7_9FLAO|nr:T9SS type A sorting domain-containing protein [Brumimicrobium salinarum]PKR81301.1 hypothetical protein CW751_04380 [Brumimicrobium salinarum]
MNTLQTFRKLSTNSFSLVALPILTYLFFASGSLLSQCSHFYDDFESGAYSPTWSVGSSLDSYDVSTTNVPQGSYSLTGTGGDENHLRGFSTTFAAATPSEVSWYIYTSNTNQRESYTVMGNSSVSATNCVFFSYWHGDENNIKFINSSFGSPNFDYPATSGNWYFIELKNIDWTAKTFDIYINGTLESSDFPFRSSSQNAISEVHLYNFDINGTGYWDQITIGEANDTQAPVADAASLSDINDECEVTSLTAPTATDNCDGAITGTHSATLPITSNTTVTWTYEDASGNTATQTQNVVIDDMTNPVADVTTLPDVTNECEVTSLTAPTATDNCDGAITGTHSATLPITSNTTVTWTYEDASGDTATQTQNVVIEDVTAPVADVATLSDINDAREVTSLTAPTATDNCDGAITGTHSATLPITSNTTVTWTYEDASGNTATQTQEIIIEEIDASVTVDESTLIANNTNTGVNYQWIDCSSNAIISGETSASFTPDEGGFYALFITQNGCSKTSECEEISFVSLDIYEQNEMKLYPNPTSGKFTIETETNAIGSMYQILDAQGRLVQKGVLTSDKMQLELKNTEKGVYYLKINQLVKKIVFD